MNAAARWAFNLLSPADASARLTVLIYHRVLAERDPLFPGEPDVKRFDTQMLWIREWFNVLPLAEGIERLRAGRLPARAAAITFDDGYADNCTIALPILQRVGLPATFFVASGYLNGGRMWNDAIIDVIREAQGSDIDLTSMGLGRYSIDSIEKRREALNSILGKLKHFEPDLRGKTANELAEKFKSYPSKDLMLTSDQVRTLANSGMTIGAHTVKHPILACVDEKTAFAEMSEGKRQLESIIGREVTLFAYPNGKPDSDYTKEHVRLAREVGFSAAVSTGWGAAARDCDLFQIPRFTPWDRSKWRYALRLAQNMRQAITLVR